MLLKQGHNAPPHGAPRVPSLGLWLPLGRSLGWRGTRRTYAGLGGSSGILGCRAGYIEQALVLLLGLVQHGG